MGKNGSSQCNPTSNGYASIRGLKPRMKQNDEAIIIPTLLSAFIFLGVLEVQFQKNSYKTSKIDSSKASGRPAFQVLIS